MKNANPITKMNGEMNRTNHALENMAFGQDLERKTDHN